MEPIVYGIENIFSVKNSFDGYIRFCGIAENNAFIFQEDHNNKHSYQIIIQNGRISSHTPCVEQNTVLHIKSKYDKRTYYICTHPARLSVFSDGIKLNECLLECKKPIYITEDRSNIFITSQPAKLQVFRKLDLTLIYSFDLTLHNVVEPYHVLPLNDIFLITDCFSHTVIGINLNNERVWHYGITGKPGSQYNQLCVPIMTAYYKGNVIISEQRSNRITIINYKTRRIVDIIGKSNVVGCIDDSFWSPQAVIIGEYLYVVMCKGGNIFIRRYCYTTHMWDIFFGSPLFSRSYLNFPRGCDYSQNNKLLAVADTYHDQIILFNLDRSIFKIINSSLIKNLHWPRCVKWIDQDLYIVNSTTCEVFKSNDSFSSFQQINLPRKLLPNDQWIQAFDSFNHIWLLAFERQVVLWDSETQQLRWNSLDQLNLSDVHFAQLINEDCVLITDTGNNRGIFIDHEQIKELRYVFYRGEKLYFNTPRMFFLTKNKLFILDSGNSRIIICDANTLEVIHIYGGKRGWNKPRLSKPRWLCAGPEGLFFISDTDNHRVLLADIMQGWRHTEL